MSEIENHLTLTNREELHSQVRKEHICRLSSQLAQVGMTGCRTFRKVVRSKWVFHRVQCQVLSSLKKIIIKSVFQHSSLFWIEQRFFSNQSVSNALICQFLRLFTPKEADGSKSENCRKGAFTNYVYKRRGVGGQKNWLFVNFYTIKNVNGGG